MTKIVLYISWINKWKFWKLGYWHGREINLFPWKATHRVFTLPIKYHTAIRWKWNQIMDTVSQVDTAQSGHSAVFSPRLAYITNILLQWNTAYSSAASLGIAVDFESCLKISIRCTHSVVYRRAPPPLVQDPPGRDRSYGNINRDIQSENRGNLLSITFCLVYGYLIPLWLPARLRWKLLMRGGIANEGGKRETESKGKARWDDDVTLNG